jgi:diguanylate cyclase (GGDEF)-like protein
VFSIPVALQPTLMNSSKTRQSAPLPHAQPSPARDGDAMIGSMPLILCVVVLVGLLGVATAKLFHYFHLESGLLPQLLTGVAAVALVIHLNSVAQRKLTREVSVALNAAAQYAERLEQFSFMDPNTELFNRKYLDQLFNQQLRWINRTGKAATMLLFDITSDGHNMAPEHIIAEAARLLRSNFRGSDYIVRCASHQLLVLLPETTHEQAEFALVRLADKVDHWNLESRGSAMMLRHELNVCSPGGDLWATLQSIEAKLCWTSAACVAD